MNDLKQFNLNELKVIEKFTAFLADHMTDNGGSGRADFGSMKADDVSDAEIFKQVSAFAAKRNGGKNFLRSSPVDPSDNDKEIVAGVREWQDRLYRRGHGKRK
jgi:hypothetical protein